MWREARLRDPDGNIIFLYKAGEARRFPPWRMATNPQKFRVSLLANSPRGSISLAPMPRRCSFKLELEYPQPLAGVDEAGCAPLAGPVVAAACILDRDRFPRGIDDSKNLPLEKREAIYAQAGQMRRAWGVGIATVEEIDQINIYWARMLAMTRAVEALGLEPAWVLVDGNACPALAAAVEGDRRRRRQVPLDRRRLDHRQGHARPDDGANMRRAIPATAGSITAAIRRPIIAARFDELGPTPLHRRSFGLVRAA